MRRAIFFAHGFLLALLLFHLLAASYEDEIFDMIVSQALTAEMTEEEKALELMDRAHRLIKNRARVLEWEKLSTSVLRTGVRELLEGGHCGTFVHVNAELLKRAEMPVRIAQMRCGEVPTCHIILEAKVGDRWILMDPQFNHTYYRPDGIRASIGDVVGNWDAFRSQRPENFPRNFQFEEVRYTNWNKIPVLLPLMQAGLRVINPERVEKISLRTYILNGHKTYAKAIFGLWIILLIFHIAYRRRAASMSVSPKGPTPTVG